MNNTTQSNRRPPIVTIMGHVDHGKTSILDKIRKANVQAHEHGGITQHIGAYQITHSGQKITFIDTPGHAAFTQMRARGGRAADLVVLVVAADDGVKPQTKEAIAHIRAAGAPMLVAINKMDIAGANSRQVKQDLAQEGVMVEDWGGDVISIEVSAKTGAGLEDLLDAILVISAALNLSADPHGELEATVIESKVDKRRGVVVACIPRSGTLRVGDEVSASGIEAKIKSILSDTGQTLTEALPSTPVELMGFKSTPNVGDLIVEKGSELAQLAIDEQRTEIIGQNTKKTVGIIIKADTQGTLEAIKASLANLVSESVGADFSIKFVQTSTGDITESDILLAANTNSIVVGFNVKQSNTVNTLAEDHNITVKTYKTIYELIENVEELLEGTASTEESKIKGRAKISKIFKLPSGDVIAGCEVLAGALKVNNTVRIYDKDPADVTEDDVPLYVGKIQKLKNQKEDIEVAGKKTECGVLLKPNFEGLKKDLWLEVQTR